MARIWFTADYHMGHRNIIGLCNRPFADIEEMEREIVARHNELVGAGDESTTWGTSPTGARPSTRRNA